ncbi:cell wall-binding repeat-containing protein [Nostocoides sp. F2B08]|uniref:cell wall-binding repeat-containing protein n=1 Tax=Nostocoides sp. F2B08 TaxID=2653936 RepID=UPI00186B12F8|nr:cell wall-binding repeat-containing protein [Tetrasphaera sp. F2B08]
MRPRRLLVLLLLPVLLCALGSTSGAAAPAAAAVTGDLAFTIERLAGADRYATAAAISRRFFAPGVPVAVISTGVNYPDGLAAAPAAARWGGPVLLTTATSLPAATRTELLRLSPGRIVVTGGPTAVSDAVVAELRGLTTGTVTRVAGPDRYATAAALSASGFPGGAALAFVATGENFPDALAGGAAAAVMSAPVLLTQNTILTASTRAELERLGPSRIIVLGGDLAITTAVANELNQIATVERLAGSTRYATATAISARFFGTDRPGVMVATGLNFPDAISAGAAAAVVRGPVLLTTTDRLPTDVPAEIERLAPRTAYLLGATQVVGIGVAQDVQRVRGVCWSARAVTPTTSEVLTLIPGTTSPKVAFTLDMGGRLDGATSIVDYLTANQVCTTFFPTSVMAATTEGRAVMARIAAHPELFEVGNHTVHHCDLVLGGGGSPTSAPCAVPLTTTFIRSEIAGAEPTLQSLSGGMPIRPYWRPPYGSYNTTVRSIAAGVGYTKTVMWSRDTIDWSTATTTEQIISRATSPLPASGTIILAHLGGYHTYEALPTIVSTLRAAGYTMTTVSDMRDG